MADVFGGHEVTPLMVLRRRDTFAHALFQQWTHHRRGPLGGAVDFPEHLAWLMRGPLRYADHLTVIEEVFGRPAVVIYERAASAPHFGASLLEPWGIVATDLSPPLRRLVSPPMAVTLAKRALAKAVGAWPGGYAGHPWVLQYLDRAARDYEGWERASPWCDEAQRRALVAGFAEEDATLCRRYAVEGFPDWEPSAAPSGWAPPPELIDDVVAAWRAWLAEDPAARHLP